MKETPYKNPTDKETLSAGFLYGYKINKQLSQIYLGSLN